MVPRPTEPTVTAASSGVMRPHAPPVRALAPRRVATPAGTPLPGQARSRSISGRRPVDGSSVGGQPLFAGGLTRNGQRDSSPWAISTS